MNNKIRIISDKFELDDIAESVREKTKLTGKMSLGQIAHNIRQMAGIGQGILTTDATIESGDQILEGVTAYGASGIVTGTIPSQEATNIVPNDDEQIAIPAGTYAEGDVTVGPVPTETMNISLNGTYIPEDGKYFSSVNVNVESVGEGFETQSKTVIPTESQQIVFPDAEFDGLSNVIVEAIPSEYITTTDATATSEHIFLNETAYVNGKKITGTFTINEELAAQEENITEQDTIVNEILTALEGKAVGGVTNNVITTTIMEEDIDSTDQLTIPELVGANCFILQGNPMDYDEIQNLDYMMDSGNIYQLIYINGIFIVTYCQLGRGFDCGQFTETINFDKNTGTLTSNNYVFWSMSTDTSTTGVVYTVYRLG